MLRNNRKVEIHRSRAALQSRFTKKIHFFDFVSVVALMAITSRNERISLGLRNFYFLPNQKIRSQKKLELTEGTSRTTFLKYHDPHSIGKPMQIAILTSWFLLVSQWNVDHATSKMLSEKYLPLLLTFFWDGKFWFGKKYNFRNFIVFRSFLVFFRWNWNPREIFWF